MAKCKALTGSAVKGLTVDYPAFCKCGQNNWSFLYRMVSITLYSRLLDFWLHRLLRGPAIWLWHFLHKNFQFSVPISAFLCNFGQINPFKTTDAERLRFKVFGARAIYWSNAPFWIFWHSGALALARAPECQKINNGGLDQHGAKPFEQQQFGTAGAEGVNDIIVRL